MPVNITKDIILEKTPEQKWGFSFHVREAGQPAAALSTITRKYESARAYLDVAESGMKKLPAKIKRLRAKYDDVQEALQGKQGYHAECRAKATQHKAANDLREAKALLAETYPEQIDYLKPIVPELEKELEEATVRQQAVDEARAQRASKPSLPPPAAQPAKTTWQLSEKDIFPLGKKRKLPVTERTVAASPPHKRVTTVKSREEAASVQGKRTAAERGDAASRRTAAPPSPSAAGSSNTVGKKRKLEEDGESAGADRPRKISKTAGEKTGVYSPSSSPPLLSTEKKSSGAGAERTAKSGKGEVKKPAVRRLRDSMGGGAASSGVKKSSVKPRRRHSLNGLINHSNSCFSSVGIQILDCALEDSNLDRRLGALDDNLENFGIGADEIKYFDPEYAHGDDKKAQKQKQQLQKKLRDAIKKAAKAGQSEKVSVAKHLRAVLEELRDDQRGYSDKYTTPYIFQQVVAFGDADDADRKSDDLSLRQELSGDTQQDCCEYYQTVLNTLASDPHTANNDDLQALFEVQTEMHDECTGCGHKSGVREATSNYHNVDVPANPSEANLSKMLMASQTSVRDDECPACGEKKLVMKTEFKSLPENLVIKTNRTTFDKKSRKPVKVRRLLVWTSTGLLLSTTRSLR